MPAHGASQEDPGGDDSLDSEPHSMKCIGDQRVRSPGERREGVAWWVSTLGGFEGERRGRGRWLGEVEVGKSEAVWMVILQVDQYACISLFRSRY